MGNPKGSPCAKFQTRDIKFERFMAKKTKFGHFRPCSGFSSQKFMANVTVPQHA